MNEFTRMILSDLKTNEDFNLLQASIKVELYGIQIEKTIFPDNDDIADVYFSIPETIDVGILKGNSTEDNLENAKSFILILLTLNDDPSIKFDDNDIEEQVECIKEKVRTHGRIRHGEIWDEEKRLTYLKELETKITSAKRENNREA